MNELPEKQRTIVQLRDIEGKSYKEIADVLGITEEQVKVNLFRARQRIKLKYSEINDYGTISTLNNFWNAIGTVKPR